MEDFFFFFFLKLHINLGWKIQTGHNRGLLRDQPPSPLHNPRKIPSTAKPRQSGAAPANICTRPFDADAKPHRSGMELRQQNMSITPAWGRGLGGEIRGRLKPISRSPPKTLLAHPELPFRSLGQSGGGLGGGGGCSRKKKKKNLAIFFFFNQAIRGLRLLQLHFTLNRLVFPAAEPSPSALASGAMTDWFPLAARGSTMERL